MRITKYLLISSAVIPIIYYRGVYFPFITLKTILFRVIVELSLALYLSGKLKKSYPKIGIAFMIWILALIISSAFNQNFLYSFFGRIDRNLGIFTLLHLGVYFWLLTQVFSRDDYIKFFKVSVWTSMLVLLYGLATLSQGRIGSTLGNPAYLAIYSIFNFGFGLKIYFFEKKKLYLVFGSINLVTLYLAGVRGAELGLIGGLIIGLVAFYLKPIIKNKKLLISLILLFLAFSYLGYAKIFRSFLASQTAQTRFIGFNAGIRGFLEKPILGWGYENFNLVFDKYFDPKFYSFSQTETYFDRAHNIFINSLATSGLIGTLCLLVFYILSIRLILKTESKHIRSISIGILAAYLIHLQFIFDDLNSLMLFLTFLGFISGFPQKEENRGRHFYVFESKFLIPNILAASAFIYIFNFLPYSQARLIAKANKISDIKATYALYDQALSKTSFFGQKEIRILMADRILTTFGQTALTREELKKAVDSAISGIRENIRQRRDDDFLYGKISSLYNFASYVDPEKSGEYTSLAKEMEDVAIKLSPNRVQLYLIAAETRIIAKEYSQALELYDKALSLNGDYLEAQWFAGKGHVLAGDEEVGIKLLNAALDKRYEPRSLNLIIILMNEMAKRKEYKILTELYSIALRVDPNFKPPFDIENVSQ